MVECRDAGPLRPGGFMVNRSIWQIAAAAVETSWEDELAACLKQVVALAADLCSTKTRISLTEHGGLPSGNGDSIGILMVI